MPRSAANRSIAVNAVGRTTLRPASMRARSSRSFTISERVRRRAADEAHLALLLVGERTVRPVHQQPGDVEDGVERRPELVADVGQEARLELGGPGEVGRLLVELGVQRQHAAIGLRELLVEPLDLDLPLARSPRSSAQQLLVLGPDLDVRVRQARPARARGSAEPPVSAGDGGGLGREQLPEHHGGAGPGARLDLEPVAQPPGAEDAQPHAGGGAIAAVEHVRSAWRCPGPRSRTRDHQRGRRRASSSNVTLPPRGVLEGVAGDLRDRRRQPGLVLRVEAEQPRDLARPLAGEHDVVLASDLGGEDREWSCGARLAVPPRR